MISSCLRFCKNRYLGTGIYLRALLSPFQLFSLPLSMTHLVNSSAVFFSLVTHQLVDVLTHQNRNACKQKKRGKRKKRGNKEVFVYMNERMNEWRVGEVKGKIREITGRVMSESSQKWVWYWWNACLDGVWVRTARRVSMQACKDYVCWSIGLGVK